MNTIVVTRHRTLVDYLIEKKYIPHNAEVIAHATSDTEIPLNVPTELRGQELTLDQIRQFASEPVSYKVTKL